MGRGHLGFIPYGVLRIMEYEIWFVMGMSICLFDFKQNICSSKYSLPFSVAAGIIFIIFSVFAYIMNIEWEIGEIILGIVACLSIIILIIKIYGSKKQGVLFGFMAKYTMPLFLMHTMFAAGIRIILFKIGIIQSGVHIVVGVFVSFVGPVLAANIMSSVSVLDCLLYPTKYIKIN